MKSTVAVYNSHEKALNAIKALGKDHFPMKHISLIGKAELKDDHVHVKSDDKASTVVPVAVGSVIGLLTGLGIFAIPGLGFLYGAGALVGAIAGFDFGLIGGMAVELTKLGFKKDTGIKLEEHIKKGKFLLIAQGTEEEIQTAKKILHTDGTHLELDIHES
ncbi:MAG: hypothetical protein ABI315_00420 [Bacteroidia bacterium]